MHVVDPHSAATYPLPFSINLRGGDLKVAFLTITAEPPSFGMARRRFPAKYHAHQDRDRKDLGPYERGSDLPGEASQPYLFMAAWLLRLRLHGVAFLPRHGRGTDRGIFPLLPLWEWRGVLHLFHPHLSRVDPLPTAAARTLPTKDRCGPGKGGGWVALSLAFLLGAVQARDPALWPSGRLKLAHKGHLAADLQSRAICPSFPHL